MKPRSRKYFSLCASIFFAISWTTCVIHDALASESPVFHGRRDIKKVALTFDACPAHDMKVDWDLLKILTDRKIPATLFLSGRWIEKFPEETRQISQYHFFEMAIHGYRHGHMTSWSEASIREDLTKAQEDLKKETGKTATYFRPPYGEYNDLLIDTAKSMGLTTIEYEVVSGDPSPTVGKKSLFRHVTTETQAGSIIIMHMNGRGWHSAEALPDIIDDLQARGFVFVTLSELLNYPFLK